MPRRLGSEPYCPDCRLLTTNQRRAQLNKINRKKGKADAPKGQAKEPIPSEPQGESSAMGARRGAVVDRKNGKANTPEGRTNEPTPSEPQGESSATGERRGAADRQRTLTNAILALIPEEEGLIQVTGEDLISERGFTWWHEEPEDPRGINFEPAHGPNSPSPTLTERITAFEAELAAIPYRRPSQTRTIEPEEPVAPSPFNQVGLTLPLNTTLPQFPTHSPPLEAIPLALPRTDNVSSAEDALHDAELDGENIGEQSED